MFAYHVGGPPTETCLRPREGKSRGRPHCAPGGCLGGNLHYVGYIADLRARYDAVRESLEPWLGDDIRTDLMAWSSGELAADSFGVGANSIDALCLLSAYERQLPYVLWFQVQAALDEGFSWAAIAAALGVSRQAAVKRFAEGIPYRH